MNLLQSSVHFSWFNACSQMRLIGSRWKSYKTILSYQKSWRETLWLACQQKNSLKSYPRLILQLQRQWKILWEVPILTKVNPTHVYIAQKMVTSLRYLWLSLWAQALSTAQSILQRYKIQLTSKIMLPLLLRKQSLTHKMKVKFSLGKVLLIASKRIISLLSTKQHLRCHNVRILKVPKATWLTVKNKRKRRNQSRHQMTVTWIAKILMTPCLSSLKRVSTAQTSVQQDSHPLKNKKMQRNSFTNRVMT